MGQRIARPGASSVVPIVSIFLALANPADALETISYESGSNTISLSVVGTYRGGFFSRNTPASPPGYDPSTKRLFVGSVDRQGVDVIDISNLPTLNRLFTIDIKDYGAEPQSVAVHKGIVAVSVQTDGEPTSNILFYSAALGESDPPIKVLEIEDRVVGRIAFTPNGKNLVATVPGFASDQDCSQDPDGAIAVIDLGNVNWGGCGQRADTCNIQPTARIADFAAFDDEQGKKAALLAGGARFYGPNPDITVAQDATPEGLHTSSDSRFAWVTLERNNAIAKVDIKEARVVDIYPLGSKDHSLPGAGFDASDRDKRINIQPWPVRSFYSPDGIAAVGGGKNTYLVTADEGDPKDDACYSERIRAGDKAYVLDSEAFPDAATLKDNVNLGRLGVTKANGDAGDDGDYDEIYMLGSRSFSVWTTSGELVFNSGDAFEQITAIAIPEYFNTSEDEIALDARSDDRGPEPEHLTVGKIDGRDYLFVGFERIGGFVAYDITDPKNPAFQQYINNRSLAKSPKAAGVCTETGEKGQPELPSCAELGDLEPEGFVFIAKADSPINVPLLAVIHELSDSTTVYRIDKVAGR